MNPLPARRARLLLLAGLVFLAGCSTIDTSRAPALDRNAPWVVLPFANHTETPLAGNRAEAIAESQLRASGIFRLRRYPASLQQESLFEPGGRQAHDAALEWARKEGASYALAGSVEEWRYKVGVDGEPAVGLTLSIIDLGKGETVWSGSGGQSGWSREALSAVAQQLTRRLLRSGFAASSN